MAVANEHKLKTVISAELDLNNASNAITQIEKINETSKKTAESLKQMEKAMQNIGKSTNNNSSKSASQSWLTQQKQMYNSGLQSYDQYAKQVQEKERQLYAELVNIRKTQGDNSKEFKQKLSEHQSYAKAVQQIEKQITSQINAEAKARASYNQKSINDSISQYKKLSTEVSKALTTSKGSFSSNIFNSMLSYGAIQQVTMAVQDLGRAMVDIQYNTINNQRLMGNWSTELRDNLNASASEIAKSTNIQITDAQQIQGAWIRINDTYAENVDLLGEISQLTSEFMNVGEIEDAETAVTLLNASLLQLGDTTRDTASVAEEFLNKWAYMADKTAMGTADEYGEAIGKYGAQLRAMGGDMDDAIVQSSILADALAMNGSEIGNALKTFNTYLTRDKTVGLMDEIAESTGDVSFKLADANGKLKDYDELIRTVARAYQMYKDSGNDLMANKVLDAVGATRRRDVAMAMLNSANSGSMDSYYELLGNGEIGNYLEEQNAALMSTLSAQWNALVVSMQQAGMELGNAGILDGITNLVQGATYAFDAFSALPAPVKQFASTLLMLKTAATGIKKIGDITGFDSNWLQQMSQGTTKMREMAKEYVDTSQQIVERQQKLAQVSSSLDMGTDSYYEGQLALEEYANALKSAESAYQEGKINAEELSTSIDKATTNYLQEISAINKNAQAKLELAQKTAKLTEEELERARIDGDEAEEAALTERLTQERQELARATKEAEAAERNFKNAQKTAGDTLNSSLGKQNKELQNFAKNAKDVGNSSENIEKVGIASKIASGGINILKSAFMTLFDPVNLIVTGVTLLVSWLMNSGNTAEQSAEKISTYQDRISEVESELQNLQEIQSSGQGSSDIDERISALQSEKKELQQLVELEKQRQAISELMEHQGGIKLGENTYIGGTDSFAERIDKNIDKLDKYKKSIESAENTLRGMESRNNTQGIDTWTDKLKSAKESYVDTATEIIKAHSELKTNLENGLYGESGSESYEFAKKELEDMDSAYQRSQKIVQEYADSLGVSTDAYSVMAEEFQEYTDSISQSVDELESKLGGLEELFGKHIQGTTFNLDEMYNLLQIAPELRDSFVEAGEGQWTLAEGISSTDQILENYRQEIQASKEDYVNSTMAGVEGYAQVSDAADKAKESQDSLNSSISDGAQKILDNVDAYSEYKKKMEELGATPVEVNIDPTSLTTIDETTTALGTLTDIIKTIPPADVRTEADQATFDYVKGLIQQVIDKQFELNKPSVLTVDTSGASDSIQAIQAKMVEYQSKLKEIEQSKALGLDTSQAEEELKTIGTEIYNLANPENGNKIPIGIEADNVDGFLEDLKTQMTAGGESTLKFDLSDAEVTGQDEFATKISNFTKEYFSADGGTPVVVKISAETSGIEDVNNLKDIISKIPANKSIVITATVNGKVNVDALKSSINSLKAKTVKVKGDVSGKDDVDSLKSSIDKVKDKTVNVTANVSGTSSVNSLAASISSLKDKTVNVTANYKTKGGLGGLFGVNGTAHVNGTASGKAFVGGNWGAKQGGTALVGELGPEIRVNSKTGRWELLGAFGAQFAKINRSDIIFNHLQTEQLLKNGYATAAGGRGKQALVNGTVYGNAFAGGYKGSYKITDDKDVAATIAVKKAAEAAMKAAQAAEAAGENVSDAMKEAAENAEKVAKSIEDITSKFINNVEDLQKRIADALKKQYQEEYDAREKLLKKEHEDKLDAIQKEIDALNGDRPEDKQAELEKLKENLAKWQGDNSTLGKAKQKEYMDKIAELEKEIKIDELEKQLENENERYENSLDSESDGYDSVLAGLDDKMSEENLYTQANEMIKNQQKEQIEALLNKYDQHWDGWATLMGKTAGQIIAEEVGYALNNYKDVTGGTITDQGGHYSDGVSLPSSGGGSSNPPAPSRQIGIGTQVNMGNAPIYGQIGGAGYPQYFSNDPVYTVVDMNGDWLLTRWHGLGSGYTGWFKKSDVKSFDTGGYTGLDEGMAMLHAKERVLTAQQTAAFDKLVYNILPKLDKELMSTNLGQSTVINNNGNTFNKELVSVNVDKIINNTPFDINNTEDNLDRMFRNSLKKSGINIKRG